MYESALERQIKPRKRRKMPDSGVSIIHWNITSSMKLFYLTSLTIRIDDILSVLYRDINDIVYKNDCNYEQRYRNVWYTYIAALNRYVFEKKATVTKIENQIALIFALEKSCCRFRSIW